jgi:hypothetical protein
MGVSFQKAQAERLFLRMALIGPSGSGKTWTALTVAEGLCGGPAACRAEDVAVIDSERRSALKYCRRDGQARGPGAWDFLYAGLESHDPRNYAEAIRGAAAAGAKVLVIDSLSHAWMGKDGALEQVDRIAKKSQSGNSFNAWRDVTPLHNQLVDAIMAAPLHVIFTLRAKMEYVVEKDERTGKNVPRKVGLAPVMRDGIEYEADIVGDMDQDNNLFITKSRCPGLHGQVIPKPGQKLAEHLIKWLGSVPAVKPAAGGQTLPEAMAAELPDRGDAHEPARQPAKAAAPKDGRELLQRLEEYEAKLEHDGVCASGELLAHVIEAGVKAGLGQDVGGWAAPGIALAAKETRAFEAKARKAAATRQPARAAG